MMQLWRGVFPGKPNYDGPGDLSDKVVIVTGGNQGLGYQLCKLLLTNNAKVYLAARSPERAASAIERLKNETGKDSIHHLQLDLASIASAEAAAAAAERLSKEEALHVVYCHGGLVDNITTKVTTDGYEALVGVNVLGHHVFVTSLLPLLQMTADECRSGTVRVVSTTSCSHTESAKDVNFSKWDCGANLPYWKAGRLAASSQSLVYIHIGNCIWTNTMNRRYNSKGILFVSVSPGIMKSESLFKHPTPILKRLIVGAFGYPPVYGAMNIMWAGVSPDVTMDLPAYYALYFRPGYEHPVARDPVIGDQLWAWVEERRPSKGTWRESCHSEAAGASVVAECLRRGPSQFY